MLILSFAAAAFAAETKQELLHDLQQAIAPANNAITNTLGGGLALPPNSSDDKKRVEIIERSLADDDLRGLLVFFRSPAGRHWIAVAPKFAADAHKALQAGTIRYIAESKQRDLEHQTRNAFRGLNFALTAYFADHQAFPEASDLAAQLVPKYSAKVPAEDAWGRPIRYRVSQNLQQYWLSSAGRDGKFASLSQLRRSDDIVYSDGRFIHNDEPISSGSFVPRDKHPSQKTKRIRELLQATEAQDTTADDVIDILGQHLGLGIAPEETRGEAREGPQMAQITDETLVPLYSRYFTDQDVRLMLAFFRTESGEHFLEAARRIATEARKNARMIGSKPQ